MIKFLIWAKKSCQIKKIKKLVKSKQVNILLFLKIRETRQEFLCNIWCQCHSEIIWKNILEYWKQSGIKIILSVPSILSQIFLPILNQNSSTFVFWVTFGTKFRHFWVKFPPLLNIQIIVAICYCFENWRTEWKWQFWGIKWRGKNVCFLGFFVTKHVFKICCNFKNMMYVYIYVS
jgi:hypothetical protein